MIDEDEYINDIFKMMDRIFGNSPITSNMNSNDITDNKYERQIEDDTIYYTFELREFEKEDIDIKPHIYDIFITLTKEGKDRTRKIKLPYPIKPKETKVTFINGILDITVMIDDSKTNRIKIEG